MQTVIPAFLARARQIRATNVLHAMKRAAQPLALSACYFLLSFIRWFGAPSPFAAALLAARDGHASPYALLGLSAALGTRLIWGIEPDWWQYAGCLMLWCVKWKFHPRSGIESVALAGLAMLPRVIASLLSGSIMDALLNCSAIPLAMLAVIGLRGGLDKESSIIEKRISITFLCLLIIGGLGYFSILGLNLGYIAAITYTIACASRLSIGAAIGFTSGLALCLNGHNSSVALSLAMIGTCCAPSLIKRYRWLCAPAATAGCLIVYGMTSFYAPPLSVWAAFIGAVVFNLLPKHTRDSADTLFAPREPCFAAGAFIALRTARLRDAIKGVAEALPNCDEKIDDEAEALGSILCTPCPKRSSCWEYDHTRSRAALSEALCCYRDGESAVEEALKRGCLRAAFIEDAIRNMLVIRRKRQTRLGKTKFERELTLTHLSALQDTLSDLDGLVGDAGDFGAFERIRSLISELSLPIRLCYTRRENGHLQVVIKMNETLPSRLPLDRLLTVLSRREDLHLSVSYAHGGVIELEENPLYRAEVCSASINADGGEVCGDVCLAWHCGSGRLVLLLSDGMGHGMAAHAQSEKTIELLTLLLEAGYSRSQAITAANGVMLAAHEDEDGFATVDMADIDLWTGETFSEKLGACPSWIIRGKNVITIKASSLPLGVMEDAAPTSERFCLHSGDMLVMVSDGVTDVFFEEGRMERALQDNMYIQPQRLADALLRDALISGGGAPKDDMSVMVMLFVNAQEM